MQTASYSQIVFLQDLNERAVSICSTVGQSKGASARVLSKLFPSSTSSTASKRASGFDPTKECVAAPQQKKKKKAVRTRPVTVSVTVVKNPKQGVPKGKKRKEEVVREQRTQKIQVTRSMSSREVRNEITRAFKHLPLKAFQIMESTTGGNLFEAKNQSPNGADLVEGVVKRKAVLYLFEQMERVSMISITVVHVCDHKYAYLVSVYS